MCFDQKTSALFAGIGLAVTYVAYRKERNSKNGFGVTIGSAYFFAMEFLQFIQYFWIDECENHINKVLTVVGYMHICFQPFFAHLMTYSLSYNENTRAQIRAVMAMCVGGGVILFSRYLMSPWAHVLPSADRPSTEWLASDGSLCTYSGNRHLAWAVPLYEATYFVPGTAIHSYMMFMPYFVIRPPKMWILGFFLLMSGPVLASYITDNLQEQASIWCFMSVIQVAVMVFLISKNQIERKSPKEQSITDKSYKCS
ncbi:DUF5765 domain-containing protein [Pelomyxa schiedti]|nr:DUF5765 domain-containing protein [Pelomyxa schiedti]